MPAVREQRVTCQGEELAAVYGKNGLEASEDLQRSAMS